MTDSPRRVKNGARWVAGVFSVSLHALLAAILFFYRPMEPEPTVPLPEVAAVVMMNPPRGPAPSETDPAAGPADQTPASSPPAAATPAPPKPAKPPVRPPEVEPLPAPVSKTATAPTPSAPVVVAAFPTVGDSQLTGAAVAGSGQGGGGGDGSGTGQCDMVRRLQDALRRDPQARAAIIAAHRSTPSSRALLVWNGAWVQSPGQEGKGLAGVRQAIALEVAFAPGPCRAQSMRGFALISLEDRPGGARLALGDGAWRWSDLLETNVRRGTFGG